MYIPSPTLQKLFIFAGSTQRWKGKNQLSFSLYYQLFVWLSVQIRSNQNTQRIFYKNVKWQVTNFLTTKDTLRILWGFLQRWWPREKTFVKCGLVYFFMINFYTPFPLVPFAGLLWVVFFVVVILNKLNSSYSSV